MANDFTFNGYVPDRIKLTGGDSREVLKRLPDNSIDSVVCDPPYALVSISKRFGKSDSKAVVVPESGSGAYARASAGFMGKSWDTGETAFDPAFWWEVLRVLKPGAHLVAFGGTRSYHRLACAIEDAGFEIRDQIGWAYGSGFPKSHDVSKGIDKQAGVEREVLETRKVAVGFDTEQQGGGGWSAGEIQITAPATEEAARWQGWGTALKPAWEPIVLARKPLIGTVAENVLEHGTGAINVDRCRVEAEARPLVVSDRRLEHNTYAPGLGGSKAIGETSLGRWPANLVHDGSDEVLACFPDTKSQGHAPAKGKGNPFGGVNDTERQEINFTDSGSAARFFYQAKASKRDRCGSKHPTVKPIALMRWLIRLVTPPDGIVLDPFAGSGTTGEAAYLEGMRCLMIEREAEYQADIRQRLQTLEDAVTPEFLR